MTYQPSWLFNPKSILREGQLWHYLTHSWVDKGFIPFLRIFVRLEFELAYYDSAIKRFNHYAIRTPPTAFRGAYLNGLQSYQNNWHYFWNDPSYLLFHSFSPIPLFLYHFISLVSPDAKNKLTVTSEER